jgi:hypothetical protein
VHDEGDAFCEIVKGREEMVGLGSGEEDLNYGLATTDVDSGWADNEVRRMAAVARPDLWIFGAYSDPKELNALHAALDRRGVMVTSSLVRSRGEALLVRFPAPADSSAARTCVGPPS